MNPESHLTLDSLATHYLTSTPTMSSIGSVADSMAGSEAAESEMADRDLARGSSSRLGASRGGGALSACSMTSAGSASAGSESGVDEAASVMDESETEMVDDAASEVVKR